jgi:uncharacterized protein with HEPN domain
MSKGKTARDYLRDMLDYLSRIERYTQSGSEAFHSDEKTQDAVIRCYEVIGEIVKRLPQTFRDEHPQVDWRTLAGFRDFLSHNYDEIILEFVWQAIEDLPALRAAIQTLFDSPPQDEGKNDDAK